MFKIIAIQVITLFLFETIFTKNLEGAWRARAREHYEIQNFEVDQQEVAGCKGLTNTLNIWYEAPPFIYVGLAGNPIIGSLTTEESKHENLTRLIRHCHLGVEAKVNLGLPFMAWGNQEDCLICNLYLRVGLYKSTIDVGGDKASIDGMSQSINLAYYIEFNKVDISIEAGTREGSYENNLQLKGRQIALGVHFLPGTELF